ncbi:MAG TPA: ATP-binding protein [Anaeromyxobacter sp.]
MRVRDHGAGIAPADRDRIFLPFERAASCMRATGFGLGLYMARRVAAAHGGVMRLESAPWGGSSFVLELPRERATAPGRGNGWLTADVRRRSAIGYVSPAEFEKRFTERQAARGARLLEVEVGARHDDGRPRSRSRRRTLRPRVSSDACSTMRSSELRSRAAVVFGTSMSPPSTGAACQGAGIAAGRSSSSSTSGAPLDSALSAPSAPGVTDFGAPVVRSAPSGKEEGRDPTVSRTKSRPSESGRQDSNLRPLGPEQSARSHPYPAGPLANSSNPPSIRHFSRRLVLSLGVAHGTEKSHPKRTPHPERTPGIGSIG